MVLRMVRVLLNEIVQVVSPWRRAPVGGNVLANQGGVGFAGVGSAGCDGHESEDLLGPLWFAVPKKRVSSLVGTARVPWLFGKKVGVELS